MSFGCFDELIGELLASVFLEALKKLMYKNLD